jgi:uncharacterized membrane protein
MDSKKWYASKGIWAAIITAVVGAAQTICLQFGFDLLANPVASIILSFLGAIGVYARVTANTVIAK